MLSACLPSRRPRRVASGQAIVEFTLASLFFFGMFLATVNAGAIVLNYVKFRHGVAEAARYARVHPTASSDVRAKVTTAAPSVKDVSVTLTCSGSCQYGSSTVNVSATGYYTPAFLKPFGLSHFKFTRMRFQVSSTVNLW